MRRLREKEVFRARGRPSVRLAPVWTYTRGQREFAAQLRGPTGRPRRAAAPLKPKALSHEEAPTPPPRHTPLHEAPRPWARDPRPARDSRARREGGREEVTAEPAEAARGPLAAAAGTAAPPSPALAGGRRRAALTSGDAMGLARPCGTDGQAGGRQAGAARDAQTRGHYFCSEPRPLIKPHGAAPPPSGPDEKHLCRPRPGPRPFQPAGRRAWPPTWSRAPGRGRALRPQPLLATVTPLGRREARLSTPLT